MTQQPGALPDLARPFPTGAGIDGFSLAFQISAWGPREPQLDSPREIAGFTG